jgi:hypothetical protein
MRLIQSEKPLTQLPGAFATPYRQFWDYYGYEGFHGPLHYQYDSRTWAGTEGMLYRVATVVKPLTPVGKVDYQGELWNAASLSGERIGVGERVEVITVERLRLYVDRVPPRAESIAKT